MIDPSNGMQVRDFNISGGWFVTGLGYWAGTEGEFLYTCGCVVEDMHRYVAADGSGPEFFWSTVYESKSVAGDNGGRIFSFARANSADPDFDIYEIDPVNNVGPLNSFAAPSQDIRGMGFDGQYLYASDSRNNLYTLDPNNGTLLNTVQTPFTLWALASTEGSPNIIPEPSSVLVWSMAVFVSVFGCRRRRSHSR